MESPSKADSGNDDARILEIANELSVTLGLSRRNSTILWTPNVPLGRPWFVRGNVLLLRDTLRGRLSAEEWRPLLASSLIYDHRFQWRRSIVGFLFLGGSLFFSALWVWFLFSLVVPNQTCHGNGCGGELIFPPFAVFLLFGFMTAPLFKKMKLQADHRTIIELGSDETMINALKTIQSLQLETPRSRYVPTWSPTIEQRLKNISNDDGMQ